MCLANTFSARSRSRFTGSCRSYSLSGSRMAYRYFRYTRTRQHARSPQSNPTLILGRAADADAVLLRGIESGAITNIWPAGILSSSPAERGQSIRGIAVRGNFEMLDNVVNDLAQRGTTITRVPIFTPTALDPGRQAGSDLDARAPARPHCQPAAVARRRRRTAAAGARQCRRPVAAAEREDRLCRAGKVPAGALDRGDRRRRLDRLPEICDRVGGLRRRAPADHREFRAGFARAPGDARHQAHAARDHRPHRRRARPRPVVPAIERVQAGYRFPRCGAQARAALGSQLGGGGQDQRVRLGQRRRCGRPRPEPPRW